MLTRPKSMVEQTADWLREGILAGRWGRDIPGVPAIAAQGGVAKGTAQRALRLLEKQGLLGNGGNGRRRQVLGATEVGVRGRRFRVGILLRDRLDNEDAGFRRIMNDIQRELEAGGHVCVTAPKTLVDFKLDEQRARKMVEKMPADLWLVVGGPLALVEWFAARPQPAFFIGGSMPWHPVAGIGLDTSRTHADTIDQLRALGHRRIVFFLPGYHLRRKDSSSISSIKPALAAHGISAGPFNLPEWDESPAGLHEKLESMFKLSPPTAIIADYPAWAIGILGFLARKKLRVPEDVSLICMNDDPAFDWLQPRMACYKADDSKFVRRVLRWVDNMARGVEDKMTTLVPTKLDTGESIGPARG